MTGVIVNDLMVDQVRPDDRRRLEVMFAGCSAGTVQHRFFGRLRALPHGYLDDVVAGCPDHHDAVVVRFGNGLRIAGLGSLAVGSPIGSRVAELGVLVADPWQRRGVGSALVTALLMRARRRGIVRVTASVLPERQQLLAALARRLELERVCLDADSLTGVYRLR
jgi:GNAT superfamily N-acetyltransferase